MEMWRWEPREHGRKNGSRSTSQTSQSLFSKAIGLFTRRGSSSAKPENARRPIFFRRHALRFSSTRPWQVPESIIKKEIMSKPGALGRRGYEVKTVGGRLTVRQLPGDDNALGRFRLHVSERSRDLFARHAVQGPLRRGNPRLSAMAASASRIRRASPCSCSAANQTGWTDERIEAALGGKRNAQFFLPHPVPIHIQYFTDFV